MNLDKAIKRAKEVASEQKRRSGLCTTSDNECDKFSSCIKCAEEHEQLAEWLISVGDKVYRIKLNTNACSKCKYFERGYDADFCRNKDVKDAEIEYGEISMDPQYTEKLLCKKHFYEIEPYYFQDIDDIFNKRKEFGKTIFFTKKEAKAKLKTLQEENN